MFRGTPRDIAEFFVMRKYRNSGVGTTAAKSIFERYPGQWTVRQQFTNPDATAFWRKAISYSFEETTVYGEVVQTFLAGDPN